jgi:hypothetical protein
MVPEVYAALKTRRTEQGDPGTGWVFPTGSSSGHMEECTATFYHNEAQRRLAAASEAYEAWKQGRRDGDWKDAVTEASKLEREYLNKHNATVQAGCKQFEIYCLRHSALTVFAESGCDAFTQLRLHSATVTHNLTRSKEPSEISQVGTELGTHQNYPQTKKATIRSPHNLHIADCK